MTVLDDEAPVDQDQPIIASPEVQDTECCKISEPYVCVFLISLTHSAYTNPPRPRLGVEEWKGLSSDG
jgi:hypothetical protein